jgi:uncharacterized protein (TIGR03437 family)
MRNSTLLLLCAVLLLCASGLLADTAQTYPFLTQLLPANETPPISDTSTASVVVLVHVIRDGSGTITSGSVDFNVNTKFSGTSTSVVGLHIHNAAAGTAGAIVIPTDVSSIAIDSTGKLQIVKQVQFPQTAPSVTIATVADLLVNPQNYYVNVHTNDHPGGAMRGQLLPAEMTVAIGLMNPKNEVPPVPSNGTAIGTVTALRARDTTGKVVLGDVIFNVDYTGFDATTFTGLHIHTGSSTVAGPVTISSGLAAGTPVSASGAGNLFYDVAITPSDAGYAAEINTLNGVFDNTTGFYINVHTNLFGGGAARDTLRRTDSTSFQVKLDPANETPPITGVSQSATTNVTAYTIRNSDATSSVAAGVVIFDVNFRAFPAPTSFTGLHLHTGAAGVAGPVTIPSGVSGGAAAVASDTGSGNIYRNVNVTSASAVAALNLLVQNPNGLYENLHTTVFGGGAARSQVTDPLSKPVIGGIAATSSTVLTAAPGSIISLYGSNFDAFTSSTAAFNPLTISSLPTSLNGVTVTVGGASAPFYFVSPAQINVQVPLEVTPGVQQVVVTNAAGSSASFNLTVASVAPSIFIVDQTSNLGAILKNVDFSLVTASNPAKVGDVLLVYSGGLGQTTPALQTGVLLPLTGALLNTGTMTATIGGQPATVIYSIASPGFAGLYQTAVTVPVGVSGNSALVLKAGTGAPSNSVNVPVQ